MKLDPKKLIGRFDQLKQNRGTWENHWQELALYMRPALDEINTKRTPGSKRNNQLTDSTGPQSLEVLASSLHTMLTNSEQKWFSFTTGDQKIDDQSEVREWVEDTRTRMHLMMNASNFQTAASEYYIDLGLFGTGAISVLEDKDLVVSYNTRHINEIVIDENNKGLIDEVYRKYEWKARNIVAEYGLENVSDKVRSAFEANSDQMFTLIHAVYPDDKGDGQKTQGITMPYISHVVEKESFHELDIKGFHEQPFIVARWSKGTGEMYGRSPAMNVLPDVKMINIMQESVIRGAQKTIDPPLQVPDDGFVRPVITRPGGLNYVRPGANSQIRPIFNDARIDFGFQATDRVAKQIKEGFFVDQLSLVINGRMTTQEVFQRVTESLRVLSPMLSRIQSEALVPLVSRTFNIMDRKGLLDDPPAAIDKKKLDVTFTSEITMALKRQETDRMITWMNNVVAPIAQVKPDALDLIDEDAMTRISVDAGGIRPQILRQEKEVKEIRQARAEAQQEALEQQQEAQEAENLKNVSGLAKANQ